MHPSIRPALSIPFACLTLLSQPIMALTLHDAQEILLRDNPDLSVLRLEVERAEAQVQESQAAWFPSLDAIASYSYTSETPHLKLDLPFPPPDGTHLNRALGDHDKVELGVDATYPLFTGMTRGRNIAAKRAGVELRQAQWQGAKNQMSFKLGALYSAWQMAAAQAGYQEKVLGYSKDLEKQIQDFVRAGTAVRSRSLAATAKSRATEVDLLSSQNTRDSLALEMFHFLGGKELGSKVLSGKELGNGALSASRLFPEISMDTTAPTTPNWDGVNSSSLNRPEAEALDKGVEQAEYGVQALAGQRWPQVYGMAGLRYANPGLDLAGDEFMPYGLVAVQLKWNLFDGTKNSAQRKQLDITARELSEQKRKLEQEWSKSILTARLQYSKWNAQYLAAEASRDAAEAASADLRRQFDEGVATGVEWLEARNNQARAELTMDQARIMQRLALLQWEYAVGKELRF